VSRFTSHFALALAIVQLLAAAESTLMLVGGGGPGTPGLPLRDVVSASFFRADCILAIADLVIYFLLRHGTRHLWAVGLTGFAHVASSNALRNAASRIDNRPLLLLLTAVHHLGAAAWIGGMASLLIATRASQDARKIHAMAQRFSTIAIISVAALVLAGIGMAKLYVGSWTGMYGTSYGVMVLAKTYLLLLALGLGASNFWLVRETRSEVAPVLKRLRRFSETEIGLGFTAVLAAASLTSQAPAIDVGNQNMLTAHEIVQRTSWQWPRLETPRLADLPKAAPLKQHLEDTSFTGGSTNDAISQKWSEYNHQWSGLIVLAAGLLALVSRFKGQGWARNWPLLFFGLAVFIALRADADAWPLGPRPFWGSFAEAEVLEHRLFAALITCFAIFEWAVETGRLKDGKAALVFPTLCALGGALLLTHSHGTSNVKDELLAELSHTPIALLGATAGWGRWLELRWPQSDVHPETRSGIVRIASWMWPVCLMLVGLLLLDYRES